MPGFKPSHTFSFTAPIPAHAAATATESYPIFFADRAVKVRKVSLVFSAAVTGTATNYTNVNLVNRGTDGTGTTELANIDYASGQDAVAMVETSLYAPTTPLAVAAGGVLAIQLEKVSTGLALPAMLAVVEYDPV